MIIFLIIHRRFPFFRFRKGKCLGNTSQETQEKHATSHPMFFGIPIKSASEVVDNFTREQSALSLSNKANSPYRALKLSLHIGLQIT